MDDETKSFKIRACIEEFCLQCKPLPFGNLNEASFQGSLLALLRSCINETVRFDQRGKGFDVNVFQAEYAANRIDIVCIDKNQADIKLGESKDKLDLKLQDILWNLPMFLGIEFKLQRYNYNIKKFFKGLEEDKKKLISIKGTGLGQLRRWLVLGFVQQPEIVDRKILDEHGFLPCEKDMKPMIEFDKIYVVTQEDLFCKA